MSSRRAIALRLVAAAGLVAGACSLQAAWCEPLALPLPLWRSALVGAFAGFALAPALGRRGAVLAVGLALAALALGAALPGSWLGVVLAGAGLGLATGPALRGASSRERIALLVGGALGAAAAWALPAIAWGAPLAALLASPWTWGLPRDEGARSGPGGAPLAGWRLTTTVALAAALLLPRAPDASWSGALAQALALGLGGAAAGALAAGVIAPLRGRVAIALTEALGWGVALALGAQLGAVVEEALPTRALVALAGLLAGPALARGAALGGAQTTPGSWALARSDERERIATAAAQDLAPAASWRALLTPGLVGPGLLLLALLAGGPTAAALYTRAIDRADPAARALAALGRGEAGSVAYQEAISAERLRVRRWARGGVWPTPTFLCEVGDARGRLRVLTHAGRPLDALPGRRGQELRPHAAAVLAAALPLLLGPQDRDQDRGPVLVVGLGAGVSAGTLLRAGRGVELVEPLAGVLALHADATDPFGFLSGRPLTHATLSRSSLPLLPALRVAASRTVVAGALLDERHDAEVLAALTRARCFAARVAAVGPALATALRAREGLVFALGEDQLVVAAGVAPSLALLEERWAHHPELAAALREVGLARPLELLAACATPGAALEGVSEPLGATALRARGAAGLATTLAFPGPAARAALAELWAREERPGALPMARSAVAALESSTTLRVLGDVLQLLRAKGQEVEDPVPRWQRALELDPEDVGARLSLAWRYHDQQQLQPARRVLLPAVGRDPQREREVQYLLGLVALGLEEYPAARLHLGAARGFRNAEDLIALSLSLERPAQRPPDATSRLAAAKLFLKKADQSEGLPRANALMDAAETLAKVANALPSLDPATQLELARLLRVTGEGLAAMGGAAEARAVARTEAAVLEPLARSDPRRALEHARALLRGGESARAVAALREQASGAGARDPAVHEALGDALAADGQLDASVAEYDQALALNQATSASSRVYLSLAAAYRRAQRPDRALAVLDQAKRLFPGHAAVLLELGDACLAANRPGDALGAYREWLGLVPRTHTERARVEREVARIEHEGRPR
ncbi:MAG: tetratricopeptide repeat protein [Planctomycetota bacterium]